MIRWTPARGYSDRNGVKVDWIVVHYTAGNWPGDLEWLRRSPAPGYPSAHFYIRANGDIYQLVRLENAAHHAGITWSRPYTWQWRRWRALRPNERSVGIEIEGYGEFTAKQYRALIWLIPLLALRFNIPIKLLSDPWRGHDPAVNKKHGGDACEIDELQDFRGILGHGAIHYSKVDPGLNFDYDTIAALEPLTIGPASFPENVIWRGDPAQLPGEGMVYA